MLAALKTLFAEFSVAGGTTPASTDQRQLQLAVAALLHEMTRVDASHSEREQERAVRALVAMFGLPEVEAMALLTETGAQRLTSYFDPASIIKRMLSIEQRCTLVENLWHVAFADKDLHIYEDQFVRKIAHLIYVPNTQCMLARKRARTLADAEDGNPSRQDQ